MSRRRTGACAAAPPHVAQQQRADGQSLCCNIKGQHTVGETTSFYITDCSTLSLTLPPSPEFACELLWPVHTNLDTFFLSASLA